MNSNNPEASPVNKAGVVTRRVALATGAGLGIAGALGFKPQEAQAATPTEGSIAPSPDATTVSNPLTESLSKQVDALNSQLEQAGISGGPGKLYANAWVNADGVTRIPYEGIIFKQLPGGNLIPDQTLMQIDRQPGFSDGLSQGLINGQPVETIPLPGNGEEVTVDPKISTVVNNLSKLFNTRYRVTATQAHEQFNVFRVATPNTEGVWEDSFALRQDYAGPKAGLITFANIAEPARLANIIPLETLFEPGEAGTGGGETTETQLNLPYLRRFPNKEGGKVWFNNTGNQIGLTIGDAELLEQTITFLADKYRPNGVEFFFPSLEDFVNLQRGTDRVQDRLTNLKTEDMFFSSFNQAFLKNTAMIIGQRKDGVTEIYLGLSLIPGANPTAEDIREHGLMLTETLAREMIGGRNDQTKDDFMIVQKLLTARKFREEDKPSPLMPAIAPS